MSKIQHFIRHNDVESDLVYPLDKGYIYICVVDSKWIIGQLKMAFGGEVVSINNKYAVEIKGRIYTNHDGKYWLIESSK